MPETHVAITTTGAPFKTACSLSLSTFTQSVTDQLRCMLIGHSLHFKLALTVLAGLKVYIFMTCLSQIACLQNYN